MKPPFEMIQETEIEKWRYETFWTKEPETIEWIGCIYDGTLVDIGANIGLYSLYCAYYPSRVIAIEPFRKNFDRLCENIKLNGFENISPINIAIGEEDCAYDYFKPVSQEIGSSGHQLIKSPYQERDVIDRQYFSRKIHDNGEDCLVMSLDHLFSLAKMFLFPINHIKIDTDGNEYDIILGGKETLASQDLRSVLIEINDHKEEIIEIFKQNGFTTDNRFNTMTPHSRERRAKEGIKAENIIFTRR
jgi:FkbM family methyltransferase